ncbi:hypothetical protein [Pseudogemmobacter sonorensis]|uniref:hypothetical protein n=1 Tax=Pseudogemmobacter sonorensis TaxID=2989681 RepID=UPI00368DFCBF
MRTRASAFPVGGSRSADGGLTYSDADPAPSVTQGAYRHSHRDGRPYTPEGEMK